MGGQVGRPLGPNPWHRVAAIVGPGLGALRLDAIPRPLPRTLRWVSRVHEGKTLIHIRYQTLGIKGSGTFQVLIRY